MTDDKFRLLIAHGDINGIRRALEADPEFANRTISWYLNQNNETDPLHYVSDCVGNGWLKNGTEGEIAKLLLAFGAEHARPWADLERENEAGDRCAHQIGQ
jgi:hypothetical protein